MTGEKDRIEQNVPKRCLGTQGMVRRSHLRRVRGKYQGYHVPGEAKGGIVNGHVVWFLQVKSVTRGQFSDPTSEPRRAKPMLTVASVSTMLIRVTDIAKGVDLLNMYFRGAK